MVLTRCQVRAFCYGLREWNAVFAETDFKLTDGIPRKQGFKALTIRKTGGRAVAA